MGEVPSSPWHTRRTTFCYTFLLKNDENKDYETIKMTDVDLVRSQPRILVCLLFVIGNTILMVARETKKVNDTDNVTDEKEREKVVAKDLM